VIVEQSEGNTSRTGKIEEMQGWLRAMMSQSRAIIYKIIVLLLVLYWCENLSLAERKNID
jgi:hypothetical protein